MSPIQASFNPEGLEILSREGRLLCSPRNPLKEAEEWVLRYKELIGLTNNIAIVGCGAGYHVLELEKKYPNKNILVFDLDFAFSNIEKKFKSKLILDKNAKKIRSDFMDFFSSWPVVLAFRPAFQPFEKEYIQLWMDLTERTAENENKLLQSKGYESEEEAKIWMCLRELIK